ncbi:MAG: guanylate kinase [Selenomonadaceae bacterium]|nr:guanylate kinase [Selenomonadaceae bacterium]
MDRGILLVISGSSGTGKGTVCNSLRKRRPDLEYSISATTRSPRAGETDGVEYFFLTRDEFKRKIEAGDFLEYADNYGNFYGTPRDKVLELLNLGKTILLEIDVQGAHQVQKNYPDGVFIFLLPPSIEELKRRIIGRNSETEESIQKRLSIVNDELESGKSYNYVVVNDEVERAVDEICAILDAESLKVGRNLNLFDELVKNS